MVEFINNNAKNISSGYTFFELNCGYHLHIFFENKFDLCLRFCLADKLIKKLSDLILIC